MESEFLCSGDKGHDPDRRVIRVDFPSSTAGITAALRRAFKEAAEEPSAHDFEALLQRLQ